MLCECKRKKEFWDAIGNSKAGYYTKRELRLMLFAGAIPFIGQAAAIMVFICSLFGVKKRVPKQYRLDYIRELVDKDMNKRKHK